MNITVLYSEPTAYARQTMYSLTDEDTGYSARLVASALKRLGHRTKLHPLTETNIHSLKKIKSHCIFNLIEWTGRDLEHAKMAMTIIEQLGIPYTGVNALGYERTTNKILMKRLFDQHGIPTPAWQAVYKPNDEIRSDFQYPVIMKPALEHCSVGIYADYFTGPVKPSAVFFIKRDPIRGKVSVMHAFECSFVKLWIPAYRMTYPPVCTSS